MSLRNRLARFGVAVVTIKPGPVNTPMTAGLGKLPLIIDADVAADQILSAAGDGAIVAYVPSKWRPIMRVIRNIPSKTIIETSRQVAPAGTGRVGEDFRVDGDSSANRSST